MTDAIDTPFGGSWSTDGTIFIGQGPRGIVRIPAGGGKPETVVPAKSGEADDGPSLLPDGENLLFTAAGSGPGAGGSRWDSAQIIVQNLKTGARKVVIEAGSDARYIPTGHLLYAVGGTVFAAPFDTKKLQVTGGTVPVVEGVQRPLNAQTGAAFFSVSDDGSLIWVPGESSGMLNRVLAFVDWSGGKKVVPVPPAAYEIPRISPDGKHVVVGIGEPKGSNVWIYDLNSNTSMRRLTFGGRNERPLWTTDGRRVVFRSDREGEGLYWQSAEGGPAERLSTADTGYHAPQDWTPDGKVLAFFFSQSRGGGSIWTLEFGGDRKPKPLIEAKSNSRTLLHRLAFSPDGHWMAYGSNEDSNNFDVYVQPFPPNGAKYKISVKDGADSPVWTPDGRQIVFESRGQLMFVDLQTRPAFTFTEPKALPVETELSGLGRPYDITRDGKQFLVIQRAPEAGGSEKSPAKMNIVLNWFTELQQRVPVK